MTRIDRQSTLTVLAVELLALVAAVVALVPDLFH